MSGVSTFATTPDGPLNLSYLSEANVLAAMGSVVKARSQSSKGSGNAALCDLDSCPRQVAVGYHKSCPDFTHGFPKLVKGNEFQLPDRKRNSVILVTRILLLLSYLLLSRRV
jgi:hypothetical protein